MPHFKPEQFTLAPHAAGFEFDAEVASRIVSEIYRRNKAGQAGNNFAVREYQIDPSGILENGTPNRPHGEDEPGFMTSFHAFDSSIATEENGFASFNNGLFARAVQATFDLGERSNRRNVRHTFGFIGIPAVAGAIGEYFAVNSGDPGIAAGAGVGIAMVNGVTIAAGVNSLYRRAITNPNIPVFHEHHLRVAEKVVHQLGVLPPVVR